MTEEEKQLLEYMRRQQQMSRERARRDDTHLGLALKAVRLREKQLKVLEELVTEIRRLRVTGIQP